MKILVMTLLTCTAVVGQSRDELKTKYGAPVSETLIVRPGIGVTATCTSTGQISELLIFPQITDLIKSWFFVPGDIKSKTLSHGVLKEIIDELGIVSKLLDQRLWARAYSSSRRETLLSGVGVPSSAPTGRDLSLPGSISPDSVLHLEFEPVGSSATCPLVQMRVIPRSDSLDSNLYGVTIPTRRDMRL